MTDPIAVCECLAVLARSGYPVRAALEELPRRFGNHDEAVETAARRARLGGTIESCLEPLAPVFGDALPRLRSCLSGSGTNWARAVEEVAESIRARRAAEGAASIAAAGATLSARIVAGLPLLMLPIAARQMGDPVVGLSIVLGLLLGAVGYRWLISSVPAAPPDDLEAAIADEVAASIVAGTSLHEALERAAAARYELHPVLRRVRLGASWPSALRDRLPSLANALRDVHRTGLPIGDSLRRSAHVLRAAADAGFSTRVQRAPVKMVVPLVCCVLPSFVLVAIVPLLRGLAHPI